MIPFFIPFFFERRGGSRRIGHVRPTPKPQEAEPAWKPTPEQMEALMLTIEGKAPAPTSYLSRRLEDLYDGLANTYGVECDLHNEDNATKETFDNPIRALADLCDKVEKYTRQETPRSILMNALKSAQKLLAKTLENKGYL